MEIQIATIKDANEYNEIYKQFAFEQTKFLGEDQKDIVQLYKEFDFLSRNKIFLNSEYCFIQVVRDDNQSIVGFLESQISNPDMLFEKKYIYISNLYFKPEYRVGIFCLQWGGKMLAKVEQWAKQKGLEYLCNDVAVGNQVMEHINPFFGFKEYKTRYIKKI